MLAQDPLRQAAARVSKNQQRLVCPRVGFGLRVGGRFLLARYAKSSAAGPSVAM